MVYNKGKEVAGKGKRSADTEKTGGRNKRNRGVIQFFEDSAFEVDDDEYEFDDWDFFDNEFEAESSNKVNNEPGKAQSVPIFPQWEELSEGELEKMVEERYGPGSNYVTYADDMLKTKVTVDENENLPSYKEPTVWKVKCMSGREKQSVFCLMQKYVEFNSLGNKLQIISAFFIEHVKGFIYIEAERKSDIYEACKGVSTVYSSRVALVPKNEVSCAFSVRSKCNEVSIGSWVRVKNGKYKGDLAQIITINDSQKKATIKLIPRIDLQELAEKFGGGVRSKKGVVPTPRFVTSTELEEFRPLIQCRRDRESGLAFEVLDGMMIKDGYLYKKVSIDSLSVCGVIPSEAELLKFESSKNENPDCQEWLTELYGEPRVVKSDKGGVGKGEGSSSSSTESSFEVSDIVLFNRKDFGVIVGLEKEEHYKILKEGSEGPVVMTVDVHQLKKASFENRFTALDKIKKMISINDTVRVLEGPLEGRQGSVIHIYRGTIFLHDEVEPENNGFFCCKSQICEKIKCSDDPPLSPKSPLTRGKPWKTRRKNSSFKRDDQEGFTVGQSLRIRVGPLKGYLCRCLAIRRTDITVKLDSGQKILTVKSEHLAEVHRRSSAIPMSDDKGAKPFDLLGNPEGSADWMTGAGASADAERRGSGGSTKRNSWPAFPSSDASAQPESNSAMETDNKDVEGAAGWGSGRGNWGNKPKPSTGVQGGSSRISQGNWGSNSNIVSSSYANSTWGKKDNASNKGPLNSWGKGNDGASGGSNWGKSFDAMDKVSSESGGYWGTPVAKPRTQTPPWGKGSNLGGGQGRNWGRSNTKNNDSAPACCKNVETPTVYQGGSRSKSNTGNNDVAPTWGKNVATPAACQGGIWGKNNTKRDNSTPAWGKTFEPPAAGGSWGKSNTKNNDSAPAWGQQNGGNSEGFDDRRGRGGWRGSGRGGRSYGKDGQGGEKRGFGGGRGGRGRSSYGRDERGGFRGGKGGRGGRLCGTNDEQGGGRGGWSDRGRRGGGDRGSFRGRGRSNRGSGGERGRGRRDENSEWGNNQNGGGRGDRSWDSSRGWGNNGGGGSRGW